jgi:hypothetical protein
MEDEIANGVGSACGLDAESVGSWVDGTCREGGPEGDNVTFLTDMTVTNPYVVPFGATTVGAGCAAVLVAGTHDVVLDMSVLDIPLPPPSQSSLPLPPPPQYTIPHQTATCHYAMPHHTTPHYTTLPPPPPPPPPSQHYDAPHQTIPHYHTIPHHTTPHHITPYQCSTMIPPLSTINHQPSTIIHQPSIINY